MWVIYFNYFLLGRLSLLPSVGR